MPNTKEELIEHFFKNPKLNMSLFERGLELARAGLWFDASDEDSNLGYVSADMVLVVYKMSSRVGRTDQEDQEAMELYERLLAVGVDVKPLPPRGPVVPRIPMHLWPDGGN